MPSMPLGKSTPGMRAAGFNKSDFPKPATKESFTRLTPKQAAANKETISKYNARKAKHAEIAKHGSRVRKNEARKEVITKNRMKRELRAVYGGTAKPQFV